MAPGKAATHSGASLVFAVLLATYTVPAHTGTAQRCDLRCRGGAILAHGFVRGNRHIERLICVGVPVFPSKNMSTSLGVESETYTALCAIVTGTLAKSAVYEPTGKEIEI